MSAVISSCGHYRYRLERDLHKPGPTVAIFGVNPSTADHVLDDHTIRKDIGFGLRLGWGKIIKGNKFAFRSTQVKALRLQNDPIGPENDSHIEQIMRDADLHIAAWGALAKLPKSLRERWRSIVYTAGRVGCPLFCWGTALDGHPLHPLMLSYGTELREWQVPA